MIVVFQGDIQISVNRASGIGYFQFDTQIITGMKNNLPVNRANI